ncbi:MAG TPA: hypothetical protein VJ790_05520 [Dongiaceae bacterium]|nr:hypothetical protein [Dongiaceae bacterium]
MSSAVKLPGPMVTGTRPPERRADRELAIDLAGSTMTYHCGAVGRDGASRPSGRAGSRAGGNDAGMLSGVMAQVRYL